MSALGFVFCSGIKKGKQLVVSFIETAKKNPWRLYTETPVLLPPVSLFQQCQNIRSHSTSELQFFGIFQDCALIFATEFYQQEQLPYPCHLSIWLLEGLGFCFYHFVSSDFLCVNMWSEVCQLKPVSQVVEVSNQGGFDLLVFDNITGALCF